MAPSPTEKALWQQAEKLAAPFRGLALTGRRHAGSDLAGQHPRSRQGSGEAFWQFREYVPGDRPRDIDWRQSAKGERVYIRQKEQETLRTTLLHLDGSPGLFFRGPGSETTKFDTAARLAMATALILDRAGERTGLIPSSDGTGHGQGHLQRLCRDIARHYASPGYAGKPTELKGNDIAGSSGRAGAGADLILFSDFLSPPHDLQSTLRALAPLCNRMILIQIMDRAELELSYSGRAIFLGTDHTVPAGIGVAPAEYLVEDVGSIGDAYRERIRQHIGEIRACARQEGAHYLFHQNGSDMIASLNALTACLSDASNPRLQGEGTG